MLRIISEDEEEKYLKELEEKYISKYSYSSLEVIELSITTIGYMLSTVEIDSNKDHHREISNTDKLEEMNNSVELFIKEFREKLNLL
ncbi:hypothetical protein [Solibacillus isronensis]|uniref:hypothetical protein n=1 Tax=Solibacillus isronensis TaxID=412383 RepID=UPI0039A29B17